MNTKQERTKFEVWLAKSLAYPFPSFMERLAWNAWQARAALQESDKTTSQDREEAQQVLDALNSGEWQLTRILPLEYLTDATNIQQAWMVSRQTAPFCDDEGERFWVGPTAIKALRRGQKAIDHARRIEGKT